MLPRHEELVAKGRRLPARPVAIEAYWDGDTNGWYVVLCALMPTAGGRVEEHDIWVLSGGGDLRLFNQQVPPWPEAERAAEAGREIAAAHGVPFWFPAPRHPEQDAARYLVRDQGVPCARCGILLRQQDSIPWKGACYRCHLASERAAPPFRLPGVLTSGEMFRGALRWPYSDRPGAKRRIAHGLSDGAAILAVLLNVRDMRRLNDHCGFADGTDLLWRLGTALREAMPAAVIVRVGGDELAALRFGPHYVDPDPREIQHVSYHTSLACDAWRRAIEHPPPGERRPALDLGMLDLRVLRPGGPEVLGAIVLAEARRALKVLRRAPPATLQQRNVDVDGFLPGPAAEPEPRPHPKPPALGSRTAPAQWPEIAETRRRARRTWDAGQPRRAGRILGDSMSREERVAWAAAVLRALVADTEPLIEFEVLLDLAERPARWGYAHAAFDRLRARTLESEDAADCEERLLGTLFVAENAARIVYNATDPRDAFDADGDEWLAQCLADLRPHLPSGVEAAAMAAFFRDRGDVDVPGAQPGVELGLQWMRCAAPMTQEAGYAVVQACAARQIEALIAELRRELDPGLRNWLVEIVGQTRDPRCVEALTELAAGPDESAWPGALGALGAIDAQRAKAVVGAALAAERSATAPRMRLLDIARELGLALAEETPTAGVDRLVAALEERPARPAPDERLVRLMRACANHHLRRILCAWSLHEADAIPTGHGTMGDELVARSFSTPTYEKIGPGPDEGTAVHYDEPLQDIVLLSAERNTVYLVWLRDPDADVHPLDTARGIMSGSTSLLAFLQTVPVPAPVSDEPYATQGRSDSADRIFPWKTTSPEAYVARNGPRWAVFPYGGFCYRDPGLHAWIRRVAELLMVHA